MSVAQLTADELGLFAAWAVRLELLPLDDAIKVAAHISGGNCAAWAATYDDRIEPEAVDDIERAALDRLARQDFAGHCGPLAYNMIANDGRAFASLIREVSQDDEGLQAIRQLEDKIRQKQEAEARRLRRAEENAVAFDEVGKLKMYPIDEIQAACRAAGCQRLIIARFGIDESDSMTDYYGGRTARKVVIGFGKGKRENFKQLRKAAALFPPTAHMGPGYDQFCVSLYWDHNKRDDPSRAFIRFGDDWDCNEPQKDRAVVFHYYSDHYEGEKGRWGFEFETQAAADAFIAENEPLAGTYWRVGCDSYENRENYSMGGGNYLGSSRYGGWKVESRIIGDRYYGSDTMEWWQPKK